MCSAIFQRIRNGKASDGEVSEWSDREISYRSYPCQAERSRVNLISLWRSRPWRSRFRIEIPLHSTSADPRECHSPASFCVYEPKVDISFRSSHQPLYEAVHPWFDLQLASSFTARYGLLSRHVEFQCLKVQLCRIRSWQPHMRPDQVPLGYDGDGMSPFDQLCVSHNTPESLCLQPWSLVLDVRLHIPCLPVNELHHVFLHIFQECPCRRSAFLPLLSLTIISIIAAFCL
jgi:hypothetical protein